MEGDTSANESKHSTCKQMWRRSNKRRSAVQLQMLRADETQEEVLASLSGGAREAAQAARRLRVWDRAGVLEAPARGQRVTLASVAEGPGLADIGLCLGVDAASANVAVAKTLCIRATSEWGVPPSLQLVRGADSFHGTPWYSYVLSTAEDGRKRWGMVWVVLRSINDEPKKRVVVQCMMEVLARPGCVVTEYGCQRLASEFDTPSAEWPSLDVVDVASIHRVEQVHVDMWDLAERHGVAAMPSMTPKSADERRRARFFTNTFCPFTSNAQQVDP